MVFAKVKGNVFCHALLEMQKFELPLEEYKQKCEDNIQRIIDGLEIKEMKFKEFNEIIKNTTFCKFDKRNFSNSCPICKKLGISRREI
ncbi:hypothetical protein J4466_01240 [Candidatus Pacearchaeota archaeon]|nr:hypothetical protein [Candidatus Pacearchaeota archaeon]